MKSFDFAHNYHKLKLESFCTVRGVTRAKQFKVGEIVQLNKKGVQWGKAVVCRIQIFRINEINLAQMRHLVNYDDLNVIAQHLFVDHLNFYRRSNAKLSGPFDEIAIFTLKKHRE